MTQDFSISLKWRDGYQFDVDFEQEGIPTLLIDEPPPLGAGEGPNPARVLAAAVAGCVSASLHYCLSRSHLDLLDLQTRVEGTIVRSERGRLRIGSLRVLLEPTVASADVERMDRCLEIFEDFCIVGQSIRQGIDLTVEVTPHGAGLAPAA